MRLKTYTAASAGEALQRVRDELGESAVIVSTETDRTAGQTTVTAALDERVDIAEPSAPPPGDDERKATLRQGLSRHGTPDHLIERMIGAVRTSERADCLACLHSALENVYEFAPLSQTESAPPIMLVGPPGVGKTVTVAKLAARAVLNGSKPHVVTTDTVRAGAIGQLEAFTRILEVDLVTTRTLDELQATCTPTDHEGTIFIDTAGINPFDEQDIDAIALTAKSIDAEPILVMAAGGDAVEAAEIAAAFSRVGCRRILVTRVDLTRRLGSILSAADAGRMAFSEISVKPDIADGLSPLSAGALTSLLGHALGDPPSTKGSNSHG